MAEEIIDEEKRKYELSFLLTEEDGSPALSTLKRHGASLLYESPLTKMRLAYPVKKESQAYFGYFHFEASPPEILDIENELKLESKVLRYLVIVSPHLKPEAKKEPVQFFETKRREGALTNEELEKKIEEIKV